MKQRFVLATLFSLLSSSVAAQSVDDHSVPTIPADDGTVVFAVREIPDGVPRQGHGKDATEYGYRIPSLLTTSRGTILAFAERRLGLHDHAQNDIVVKRSTDGGQTWGAEIVVHEDGMNSINDPLTVQLSDGRIMVMFARFPYGRHARSAGWIQMAELGYDDLQRNVLTYITYSSDDGLTWSKPKDISREVKPDHWINANSPGAMLTIRRGPHQDRVIAPLWGTVPPKQGGKSNDRTWEIVVAHSDDNGESWQRTEPLDDPEDGFPNECQVAEAADGTLVLVSRNQSGQGFRKKTFSNDGGTTWSVIHTDPTLPSVACMGSVIAGPQRPNGTWNLFATFPSAQGRKNGRIAVSTDNGKSFEIRRIVTGAFGYSASQVSPDGRSLLCLYEANNVRDIRLLSIPFGELE